MFVLLILAGVTITGLNGKNGLLTKARDASKNTEITSVKEQAQLDITNWITEKLEKGEEIMPLTQDGVIGWHNNDSYFSIFKNGKYGVIDINGNQIIDAILPPIKTIKNDIIITQNGKLEGLVRLKDGKTLLEPVYQNIVELNQEGYYKMKSNGKWGAVDINGNIIYPCNYGPLEIGRMVKKYQKS